MKDIHPHNAIVAALPQAACLLERVSAEGEGAKDWRYRANNTAMQEMLGVGDLTGQLLRDRFPDRADEWHDNLLRAAQAQRPVLLRPYTDQNGNVYEMTLSPVGGGDTQLVLALIHDVTEAERKRKERAQAEARFKTLFDAIDEGLCVVEIRFDEAGEAADYKFVDCNRAFEAQSGLADAKGRWMREFEPDLEPEWFAIYGEVAATGKPIRFELESQAMGRWFDVYAFSAGPVGSNLVAILFEDTSERKATENALRESESRLTSLINVSSDVVYQMSADWTELRELYGKGLLLPGADPTNWIDDHVPADDRPALEAAVAECLANNTPFDEEIRVNRADGTVGWLRSRAVPVLDDAGKVREWFGMATDITESKATEAELASGAEMLRVATEIGGVGVWDWDVVTEQIRWSDAHFELLGYEVNEIAASLSAFRDRVHKDDFEAVESALEHARETRQEYVCDFRVVHPGGEVHWISARGQYLYNADGKPVRMLGAMIDTTERRRQEEWQKLLVEELQHRVRNLISMIRGMARQSASTHRTLESYVDHLIGRLQAMGRTQAMLTRSPGANVDLSSIMREELLACAAPEKAYRIEGPPVQLSPQLAEVLTLAIHELATNSVKYGALGDKGYIKISWTIIAKESTNHLALRWQETGVSAVTKPSRVGFGRQLIEERIPYELQGTGSLTIHDTGVLAEMSFPLVDGSSVLETGIEGIERQRGNASLGASEEVR
ncbi:PAS domain-containing protein [Erythrobacter sp.]|uniref:PAS domain-containing sensor histidine kinase n=1 Tax=Erythrobacter sp. TaxID=1042 RepID=UPI0025CCD21B|nr:PAS domain-containing protein [Erythrobacter sp.]